MILSMHLISYWPSPFRFFFLCHFLPFFSSSSSHSCCNCKHPSNLIPIYPFTATVAVLRRLRSRLTHVLLATTPLISRLSFHSLPPVAVLRRLRSRLPHVLLATAAFWASRRQLVLPFVHQRISRRKTETIDFCFVIISVIYIQFIIFLPSSRAAIASAIIHDHFLRC